MGFVEHPELIVVCHKWQDMGSAVHEGMQLRRRPPRSPICVERHRKL